MSSSARRSTFRLLPDFVLRWWRRRDPVERAWQDVTERMGLRPETGGEALIADLLDLPEQATLGGVHRVEQAGDVDVHAFWYRSTAHVRSREPIFVTACLLTSKEAFSSVSWRASRKLHNVIASLQASATGGEVIVLDGAEEFNQRVTLVAREGELLRLQLTPAVRSVLEKIVDRATPTPALTVGERRILLTATSADPAFDSLEFMLSDVLSLYAALARQ